MLTGGIRNQLKSLLECTHFLRLSDAWPAPVRVWREGPTCQYVLRGYSLLEGFNGLAEVEEDEIGLGEYAPVAELLESKHYPVALGHDFTTAPLHERRVLIGGYRGVQAYDVDTVAGAIPFKMCCDIRVR